MYSLAAFIGTHEHKLILSCVMIQVNFSQCAPQMLEWGKILISLT